MKTYFTTRKPTGTSQWWNKRLKDERQKLIDLGREKNQATGALWDLKWEEGKGKDKQFRKEMRGERQIEEEAVCNRKDDFSFRSEMEWNNMLKWVFLLIYCPFSSLLKKPNTFAFGAQMNQRPGCMNNFLFVSRIFFLNPHLKSTK